MKPFEIIRANLFWLIDFILGSKVRRNYNDIKFIFNYSKDHRSIEKKEQYLDKLLKHSTNNLPFYKPYKNYVSLHNYPVIDKNIIRNRFDDFVAQNYKIKKMHSVTTSGSTGTPFKIYQDKKKRLRHIADNIFFDELAETKIGSRIYYFRVWNEMIKKNKLICLMENLIPLDTSKLDDTAIERNLINRIKRDKSSITILAYASTLETFAKYLKKNYKYPFKSTIHSIISQSETLSDDARKELGYFFSSKVVSRYSNMENGFIGQQCFSGNGEYHLNEASFYVEILNFNNDTPVKNGEMGRIVITDLFNYGMPLIRYDTGDIGTLGKKANCEIDNKILTRIEGRRTDFISDTNGNLLSPHVITNTMWKYDEIHQFQFVQEKMNAYTIIINVGKNRFEKEDDLINEIKNYIGFDANISIKYVEEIPLLNSGKRKKIVNKIN